MTLRGRTTNRSISLQTGFGTSMEKERPDGKWSIAADGPSLEITDDAGRLSTVLGAVSLRPPMPAIPPEPNPPSFRAGVPVTSWVYAFGPSTLTLFDQAGNEAVQISGAVPPSMVIKGGAKNDVVWKAP